MKFSTRLGFIVGSAAFGTLVLMVIALQTTRSSMYADRQAQIRSMVNLAAKQVEGYVALEKSASLSREEAQKQAKQAISMLRDGPEYVVVRDMNGVMLIHPEAARIGKTFTDSLEALRTTDRVLEEIKIKRQDGVEVPKINGLVKIPEWGWIIGYGLFVDDIEREYKSYALRFGGIAVAIFLAVVAIAFFMARRIYRTLGGEPEEAARLARSIASGDLTQRIEKTGAAGSLMESIKQMQLDLHEIIGQIQKNSGEVGEASLSLSGQMDQINQAAKSASDAVSSTAAAIEELAVSVDHISQSSRETEKNASLATALANDGKNLVQSASSQVQRAAEQVNEASALIGGLVERSREIGSIVGVIKEIADQTNLLALNAAIEAARAGETGRGFAVVADEVRKLAERTGMATGQITEMIMAINQDTSRVVASMENVGPQVGVGVDMANQAGEALQQINEATSVALSNVSEVAAATSEQSQASTSVARNIEQISIMLEESAQSVSAANENVLVLERLAGSLRQSVARFRV